jgi:predicted nucleic acid-binding protein
MLSGIPDGTYCFVDANVICYHSVNVPPLSAECTLFFKRLENRRLRATTSTAVVAEAIHKVMLAEAVQKHGLDHRGLAHRLQRQRNLISNLEEHLKVISLIRAVEMQVEPISLGILDRSSQLSKTHQLLTNDALTISVMEKLALEHLVTNDDNFDSISDVTIWKPR